jgi:branched-chain amino acid aminotransferase
MKQRFVLLNQNIVDYKEAKLHFSDLGFLYGIGAFETIRVYSSLPFMLKEHLKRLKAAASSLNFEEEFIKKVKEEDIYKLIEKNRLKEGILKIILTPQNLLAFVDDKIPYSEDMYKTGVKVIIEKEFLQNETSKITKLKSLSFAERYIARYNAKKKGAEEVIFLNSKGYLAECSMSNIFLVMDSQALLTPSEDTGILKGITRSLVIFLAKSYNIQVKEESNLELNHLELAEEIFLTNSLMELLPVVNINDTIKKDINSFRLTRFLHDKYKRTVYYNTQNNESLKER